jgi:uncharacterized FAD-dependent dehydrogenase
MGCQARLGLTGTGWLASQGHGAVRAMNDSEYLYQGLRKSVHDPDPLRLTLARELDLPEIESVTVEREAIDARRKPVVYLYNLRFRVSRATPRLEGLLARGVVSRYEPAPLPEPERRLRLPERPVIVGFGPAGIFLGLELGRLGYKPIIYERGEPVEERVGAVQSLWREGILDPDSNLQFGEGGAGTFSDGKLTTGKRRALNDVVLQTLVEAGAPEGILYQSRPHIGTDYLRRVVGNLRQRIVESGGEVHFRHTLTDLGLGHDGVESAVVNGRAVPTTALILAIGHSARDTIEMLHGRGVAMELKPFAVGTRIEHPAAFISEAQYGREAAAVLPAADYKLTYRHKGLGVYSFCMCPGGRVVCASSEPHGLVTNGMSYYPRAEAYSNSAIVVSLDPAAYGFNSPLEAIAFQRRYEGAAYRAGGGGYLAPAQRARDFLSGRPSSTLPPVSYRPGVVPADLNAVLPAAILPALKAGLERFDRTIRGFVDQGVLIGLESRTSSPVRILRDETFQSISAPGLYPLGEGAGYAGGIMTCALDALRFAQLVRPWRS